MVANYFQDPASTFVPTTPFQPDFESMARLLSVKQSAYNQNKDKLQGIYSSIFNSKITNSKLNQDKIKFLDSVDRELSNLASNVDLSIEGNTRKAVKIFDDFYKNDKFIKDIATTRYNENQLSFAASLKSSTDPNMNSKYWTPGVQNILNAMEEMKDGDPNDDSIYKKKTYVPFRNMQADVIKAYKDSGAKFQTVEGLNGPQLLIKTNGMSNWEHINTFVRGVVGSNYNDMMEVLGQNEYWDRYKREKSNNPGMDDNLIKNQVAVGYASEKSKIINKNIKDFQKKLDSNKEVMKFLKKDGEFISQDAASQYYQLGINNKELQSSIDKSNESLEKLKGNGEDIESIRNSIMNGGPAFFASIYGENLVKNVATAIASIESVEAKENTAYTAKHREDRERYKLQMQAEHWKKMEDIAAMKAQNQLGKRSNGTKVPLGAGSPEYARDYSIVANAENTVVKEENSYEDFVREQAEKYANLRGTQLEAIRSFLPFLLRNSKGESTISSTDAAAFAAQFTQVFSPDNTEQKMPDDLDPEVLKKVEDHLKGMNIKFDPNNPESILDGLVKSFRVSSKSYSQNNTPLPDYIINSIASSLSDFDTKIDEYKKSNDSFNSQLNAKIEQHISENPALSFIVSKNNNGSYTFRPKKELTDAFAKIFTEQLMNNPGTPIHNTTESKLLETAIREYDNVVNNLKIDAASSMLQIRPEGLIGKTLDFPMIEPSTTVPLGSTGYRLFRESTKPGNFDNPYTKSSGNFNNYMKQIEWISSNPGRVSGISYDTSGYVHLNIKNSDSDKDQAKALGIGSVVEIKISPSKMGDVLNALPSTETLKVYDDVVQKGKTWETDDLLKSFGYDVKVYGNNVGTNKPSTMLYVDFTGVKAWNVDYVDDSGNPVGKWEQDPRNAGIREIALVGNNAADIDEIIAYIKSGAADHIRTVNEAKKVKIDELTKSEQLKKPMSVDEVENKINEYNINQ